MKPRPNRRPRLRPNYEARITSNGTPRRRDVSEADDYFKHGLFPRGSELGFVLRVESSRLGSFFYSVYLTPYLSLDNRGRVQWLDITFVMIAEHRFSYSPNLACASLFVCSFVCFCLYFHSIENTAKIFPI